MKDYVQNYNVKIKGMYLVCLHPNNPNQSFIRLEIPVLEKEMKSLIDLRLQSVTLTIS